jgi:Zn ribbon nucleic-acid-binding protein
MSIEIPCAVADCGASSNADNGLPFRCDAHKGVEPTRADTVSFCPQCFADDHGGSWGSGVLPGGHCINCGAGGAIAMPKWAVESIRQNASWVGRRYYPGSEDKEILDERKALLSLVETFPGREVMQARKYEAGADLANGEWVDEVGRWEIRQNTASGYMSTIVEASSRDEAMEKSRFLLRYVPEPKK